MRVYRFDAIVFDFDGVLVESVDVKTQAFAELYRSYGDLIVDQVIGYHLKHGGVSRTEKFRYFHKNFLGRTLSLGEEADLCTHFSSLVEGAVTASPWVTGAMEFIQTHWQKIPLYVASGTPVEELQRIIANRKAKQFFQGIFGAPQTKSQILRQIGVEIKCSSQRLLMVGDSITDFEGAECAGTCFFGRIPEGLPNPFPNGVVVKGDLTDLTAFVWE